MVWLRRWWQVRGHRRAIARRLEMLSETDEKLRLATEWASEDPGSQLYASLVGALLELRSALVRNIEDRRRLLELLEQREGR